MLVRSEIALRAIYAAAFIVGMVGGMAAGLAWTI